MDKPCEHKRREYWDCGCSFANQRCDSCNMNSRCMDCGALLGERPNVIDDEPVLPKPTIETFEREVEAGIIEEPITGREPGKEDRRVDKRRVRDRVQLQPRDPEMPTVESFWAGESRPIPGGVISPPERINVTVDQLVNDQTYKTIDGAELGPEIIGQPLHDRLNGAKPRKKRVPSERATIGRRNKEEAPDADSTCTPEWFADWLFKARGYVDLDPCSNPRSYIRAHRWYSLEQKLDGLRLPWHGLVFKNNPFSDPLPWQLKANYELTIGRCTELIELCKLDPSTAWWGVITAPIIRSAKVYDEQLKTWFIERTRYTPDLWIFPSRVQYDESPEIVAKRVAEYQLAKARYAETGLKSDKPKGREDGKSSNNFCSAVLHWRFDKPSLPLEEHAVLWRQTAPSVRVFEAPVSAS